MAVASTSPTAVPTTSPSSTRPRSRACAPCRSGGSRIPWCSMTDRGRRALLLAGAAASLPVFAQQRSFNVGLLTQADDERYSQQQLQKAYPDAPGGRSEPAAQIALNDSAIPLRMANWSSDKLVAIEAASAGELPAALQQLQRQGVHHVLLELPAAGVAAVSAAAAG